MKPTNKVLCIASALMVVCVPTPGAAKPSVQNIVIESPAQSPVLAQAGAEAIYLRGLADGRTMLYVENQGGRSLYILDVTHPAAIQFAGHAEIASTAPFDFVSDLPAGALIRYRSGCGFAIIDFKNWAHPRLVQSVEFSRAGSAETVGSDELLLSSGAAAPAYQAIVKDYVVVDTSTLSRPNTLATIPSVKQRMQRPETGTTFLLNPAGITVVRRLSAEKRASEAEVAFN